MLEDTYVRLIREIEVEKGKREVHEGVCAERYKNIENRFASFEGKLDMVVAATSATSRGTNNRIVTAMAGLITLLLSLVAWEAGQLYSQEPARVAAAQKLVGG